MTTKSSPTTATSRVTLTDTWRFATAHSGLTLMLGFTAALTAALLHLLGDPATILLMVPIAFVVTLALLARYEHVLNSRIADESGGPEWQVLVNDIPVGYIFDSEYARIRSRVYFDEFTCADQLFNVGWALFRICSGMVTAVPVAIFWLAVIGVLYDPTTVKSIAGLATVDLADSHVRVTLLHAFSMIAQMTLVVGSLSGLRFGACNVFERTVFDKVRKHLGCSAEGRMTLMVRGADGVAECVQRASLK